MKSVSNYIMFATLISTFSYIIMSEQFHWTIYVQIWNSSWCMVEPTENIMSEGNDWITEWCLLSRTRCKKKAQILPATHKKSTREQGQATCAALKKLCRKSLFLTTPPSGVLFMQSPNKGKNLSLMWEETQIKWTKFILTWWRNQCQLYLFLSCCLITRFGY